MACLHMELHGTTSSSARAVLLRKGAVVFDFMCRTAAWERRGGHGM